jgi:phage gp29-like protein
MKTSTKFGGNGKQQDSQTPVLDNFSKIRGDYNQQVNSPGGIRPPLTDFHGFMKGEQAFSPFLGERYGGLDKFFLTLVMGVVEDPDYALRKDPKVYRRMQRDPQIYYCIEVRKSATAGLPWTVIPPDEFQKDPMASQIAHEAEQRIKRVPQLNLLFKNILDAFLPGMSVNELVWKIDSQGKYVVKEHFPQDKTRFKFDRDGNLRLLQPAQPIIGVEVPTHKYITHIFNIADGSWLNPEDAGYIFYGKGLADTPLYHYFYFKMIALRYLLRGLERYGNPFKVFYSGPQNPQLAAKMSEILSALQNDSVVGIPGKKGETNVEVTRAASGADIFISLMEYVDKLITRAILGQELMTEMPGVGSYAAAQVHASVFARIVENDKALLQDTLNKTLMSYDAMLNTPQVPPEMWPTFSFKKEALIDASNFLSIVQKATSLGMLVSESQVRELTGLAAPEEGEGIIGGPAMMGMGGAGGPDEPPPGKSDKKEGNGADKGKQKAPKPGAAKPKAGK